MNTQHTTLLRTALLGNALFSAFSAVIFTVFSGNVSRFMGLSNPGIIWSIGIGLCLFSADLFHQATRRRLQTWRALLSSLGDTVWVSGTALLLIGFPDIVNGQGRVLLTGIALIVALFGVLQFWGAGEAHRLRNSELYRHCVSVRVPVDAGQMWSVISDLPRISHYFPALESSFLRNTKISEVGAVRQCQDHTGKSWAERCTKFEPGKCLEMEFLCHEESFPYPASAMVGGWDVVERSEGLTEIHVWWELKPKPKWLAPLIMPLLGLKADIDFPPLVHRMAGIENESRPALSRIGNLLAPTPSC